MAYPTTFAQRLVISLAPVTNSTINTALNTAFTNLYNAVNTQATGTNPTQKTRIVADLDDQVQQIARWAAAQFRTSIPTTTTTTTTTT